MYPPTRWAQETHPICMAYGFWKHQKSFTKVKRALSLYDSKLGERKTKMMERSSISFLGKALLCILRIHEELQETSTSQTEVCMLGKHNLLLAAKSMVLEQNLKLF